MIEGRFLVSIHSHEYLNILIQYTAKNSQAATSLLTSCNRLVTTSSKLVIHRFLLLVVSTSCNKSANDKFQQALF